MSDDKRNQLAGVLAGAAVPKDELTFYAEFGRFISRFAELETSIHFLFRFCSGMGDELARVFSGGQTLGQIIEMTRRVIRARRLTEVESEVEILFKQIDDISKLRHSLIHRGAILHNEKIYASNIFTARSIESAELLTLNIEDIKHASSDCAAIFLRSLYLRKQNLDVFTDEAKAWMHEPWRYKHRKPTHPKKSLHTSDQ